MGRSSGRLPSALVTGLTLPARVEHAPSGVRYSMSVGPEGHLVVDYSREGQGRPLQGRIQITDFVGGEKGYSFLHERDGYLYQAPVSFYRDPGRWAISPGYEGALAVPLSRPAQLVCVECHFSAVRPVAGTSNRFASEPYGQGGIGCERCHGPGEAHRERMLRGGGGDLRIVNPARLAPERRDSVCAQCHLQGAARVFKRGCGLSDYRPGDALGDVAPVFVWAGDLGPLDQTSHYSKLWQSACHRKAGGAMACTSCHDPHARVPAEAKVGYYRTRCLKCHEKSGCSATADLRAARGDDCVSCHMPRRGNETVAHAVTTDHSIPRVAALRPTAPADTFRELVPFWGGTPSPRDLGLAYASLTLERATYRGRAEELLRRAYGEGTRDASTLILLATFLEAGGSAEKAIPLYTEALASEGGCSDERSVAENRLGVLWATRGRASEAVSLFEQALHRVPVYEAARFNLARARASLGDVAGARKAVLEGLALEPDSVPLHEALLALR